jgi:hypothetical protein
VRVQRVALEHHGDVPGPRGQLGDVAGPDEDPAAGGYLQPGRDAQRGRLAAAGRAEQDQEVTGRDAQVKVGQHAVLVEDLGYLLEADLHRLGRPPGKPVAVAGLDVCYALAHCASPSFPGRLLTRWLIMRQQYPDHNEKLSILIYIRS